MCDKRKCQCHIRCNQENKTGKNYTFSSSIPGSLFVFFLNYINYMLGQNVNQAMNICIYVIFTLHSPVILTSILCSNVTVNICLQAHIVMNDIILKHHLYIQIKNKSLGQAMKPRWEVQLQACSIITQAIGQGAWSIPHPSRFTSYPI